MIQKERIKRLDSGRDTAPDRPYVIYWMQNAQRAEWNHALEYAIEEANRYEKPLIVYFGLTDGFPEANLRHYAFMLEGLQEVKKALEIRNIKLLVMHCPPEEGALMVSRQAALMVVDRGYLRIQKQWWDDLGRNADCPVFQVETDVIVPVEEASAKEEYAAATIRGKIQKKLDLFTVPLHSRTCLVSSTRLSLPWADIDLSDIEKVLASLRLDRSVGIAQGFRGGTSHAKQRLEDFIGNKLPHYSDLKNEPGLEYSSNLSPYLHFGQISPLYIFMRLQELEGPSKADFLEELVIRRELSMNFVFYNKDYDSYHALPSWARETLRKHENDPRENVYSMEALEGSKTADPYWNAAQREMVLTGKMHGYMRMYWGKKILEWSRTPEEAFQRAIALNNKYSLDGRDPNGFTGVAWCFGKHDRPWTERPIFGMVRYMNDKGLKRKFDMDRYLAKVSIENYGVQETLGV